MRAHDYHDFTLMACVCMYVWSTRQRYTASAPSSSDKFPDELATEHKSGARDSAISPRLVRQLLVDSSITLAPAVEFRTTDLVFVGVVVWWVFALHEGRDECVSVVQVCAPIFLMCLVAIHLFYGFWLVDRFAVARATTIH